MAAKALNTCVGLRHLQLHFRESSVYQVRFSWQGRDVKGWRKLNGLNDLLKIRGLTELRLTRSASSSFNFYFGNWQTFVEALQVMKQPHKKRHLTMQTNKDFPMQAVREVFGNTNFITRAERRLTGRKLS